MGITKLLMVIGAHSWMRALACLTVVGSSSLAATAKDEAAAVAPTLACEIRYHFRERLEGVKADAKKFSAPAYEKEALPQSMVAAAPPFHKPEQKTFSRPLSLLPDV